MARSSFSQFGGESGLSEKASVDWKNKRNFNGSLGSNLFGLTGGTENKRLITGFYFNGKLLGAKVGEILGGSGGAATPFTASAAQMLPAFFPRLLNNDILCRTFRGTGLM